jgi:murein DD-endopeptidase MepM/ murein hydrolase activator NlpD
MKNEIDPEAARRSQSLHRLAEALSEDVLNTPSETLLAEVAEDHGDRRVDAKAFDRMLGRVARRSARQRVEDWARGLVAMMRGGRAWKPLLASIGVILIVTVAGDLHVRMQDGGQLQKVADAPERPSRMGGPPVARSDRLAREGQSERLRNPSAGASRAVSPGPASGAPPADAASTSVNPSGTRTATVRPDRAERGAAVAAVSPPPQAPQTTRQSVVVAQQPLAKAAEPGTASAMGYANPVPEQPQVNGSASLAGTAGGAFPSFSWPVHGRVIARFGPIPGSLRNDGINVAVPDGTDILAAEDGLVVYAGNDAKGYGNLVLLRHSDGFVTAYAHARQLLVNLGDEVHRGQVIAKSGQTGRVTEPQVHFEIRKGTIPLDPLEYLPPS